MRISALGVAIGLYFVLTYDFSRAADLDCSVVLLQRNVEQASSNERVLKSFLLTVTEKNFESAKASAAGTAIYSSFFLDADYKKFDQRRSEYLKTEASKEEREKAEATLRITLPLDAVPKWLECMKLSATRVAGLHAALESTRWTDANLLITWTPGDGMGPLVVDDVKSTLGLKQGDRLFRGSTRVRVPKPKNEEVTGFINGHAGQDPKAFSVSFIIPERPPRQNFKAVCLSFLAPKDVKNLRQGLQRNKVYWQQRVLMGGRPYGECSLGMHPEDRVEGSVEFQIPRGAMWFTGEAGLAQQDTAPNCPDGSVRFGIAVDGRDVYPLTALSGIAEKMVPMRVSVLVSGATTLRLSVDDAGNGSKCDHFTWGYPRFE